MIENIKITLTNGQKYKLRNRETLSKIDGSRTAIFLLDDMKVYSGCCDGKVDADGEFCILIPSKNHGIAIPYARLMGWAYKRKGDTP